MGAQLLSHPEGVTLEGVHPVDRSELMTMCMDTLLLRVCSMSLSLGSRTSVHAPVQAMKCGHVYSPMSTIKQSLSVVMSDQVETLWVNFISVEWWLGNTLPRLNLTHQGVVSIGKVRNEVMGIGYLCSTHHSLQRRSIHSP